MKNILFLFAAASLILATGCEEPEPEKTAEPQIFDFQVPEEEIEAFSARIIITCSDESLLWIGDITAELTEEEIYKKTLAEADMEYKGDPAPLYIMSYDECCTICVIAVDAEGNFGDMYMEVTTLTEEGTCHDYALFDKYFNAVRSTSASAAAIRPRVNIPERPVPELSSFPKDRIMRRLLR